MEIPLAAERKNSCGLRAMCRRSRKQIPDVPLEYLGRFCGTVYLQTISDVTAVILAGGLGTRLKMATFGKQKVLAEVGGRPFLTYLLGQASSAGIRKVVLCAGYKADEIYERLGDAYGSLPILYSTEDESLGTGGALRLALPYLSSATIMVMNGDSYIDADLVAYVDWFFLKDRKAALLLTKVADTTRYGKVTINQEEKITAFDEKGTGPGPGWINAGIYLMKKSLIASIPAGRPYSLEHELFPCFAGRGLFGFCCKGRFIDIGTPDSYAAAEDFFKED